MHFVTKFGISRHIYIKIPNIKFYGNSSSECCAAACGQTNRRKDWHNEANRRISRKKNNVFFFVKSERIGYNFFVVQICITKSKIHWALACSWNFLLFWCFHIHIPFIRRTSGRIIRKFYQPGLVFLPKPHISFVSRTHTFHLLFCCYSLPPTVNWR